MDTTGRRIKRLRLKKGISQSQLSKRSGITSTLLQQYEYGTRHPKEDQLNKIALALGVAPAMLRPLDVDTIEGLLAIIYEMHSSYHGIEIIEENGTTSIRLPNTLQAEPARYALHLIKEFMEQPLFGSDEEAPVAMNADEIQPDTGVTLAEEIKWYNQQSRFLHDTEELGTLSEASYEEDTLTQNYSNIQEQP